MTDASSELLAVADDDDDDDDALLDEDGSDEGGGSFPFKEIAASAAEIWGVGAGAFDCDCGCGGGGGGGVDVAEVDGFSTTGEDLFDGGFSVVVVVVGGWTWAIAIAGSGFFSDFGVFVVGVVVVFCCWDSGVPFVVVGGVVTVAVVVVVAIVGAAGTLFGWIDKSISY